MDGAPKLRFYPDYGVTGSTVVVCHVISGNHDESDLNCHAREVLLQFNTCFNTRPSFFRIVVLA
jgi:hypothetical protein